jgi:hypothetical protein
MVNSSLLTGRIVIAVGQYFDFGARFFVKAFN